MLPERIAEYLNDSSDIDDIEAYAESFPAAKSSDEHIVGVIHAGGTQSPQGRTQFRINLRFIVSGTAATAKSKAWEIFRFFFPSGIDGCKSFEAEEYAVYDVNANSEPVLSGNTGNIFFASFVLEFMVARDT